MNHWRKERKSEQKVFSTWCVGWRPTQTSSNMPKPDGQGWNDIACSRHSWKRKNQFSEQHAVNVGPNAKFLLSLIRIDRFIVILAGRNGDREPNAEKLNNGLSDVLAHAAKSKCQKARQKWGLQMPTITSEAETWNGILQGLWSTLSDFWEQRWRSFCRCSTARRAFLET